MHKTIPVIVLSVIFSQVEIARRTVLNMKSLDRQIVGMAIAMLFLSFGLALAAPHPMASLSPKEFSQIKGVLEAAGHTDATTRHSLITLLEPPKREILS